MTSVVFSLSIALENPLYGNPGMRMFGHDYHSLLKLRSLPTTNNWAIRNASARLTKSNLVLGGDRRILLGCDGVEAEWRLITSYCKSSRTYHFTVLCDYLRSLPNPADKSMRSCTSDGGRLRVGGYETTVWNTRVPRTPARGTYACFGR